MASTCSVHRLHPPLPRPSFPAASSHLPALLRPTSTTSPAPRLYPPRTVLPSHPTHAHQTCQTPLDSSPPFCAANASLSLPSPCRHSASTPQSSILPPIPHLICPLPTLSRTQAPLAPPHPTSALLRHSQLPTLFPSHPPSPSPLPPTLNRDLTPRTHNPLSLLRGETLVISWPTTIPPSTTPSSRSSLPPACSPPPAPERPLPRLP